MLTDEDLDEGLRRANLALNILREQLLIDNEDHVRAFHRWATAERVVQLIHEVQTWRMVHGMDLSGPGVV